MDGSVSITSYGRSSWKWVFRERRSPSFTTTTAIPPRQSCSSRCREGRIRVLLGSTLKMGVGTNIQTRLAALHHLDAPWRPADVEQREGRIIRQGNLNEEVRIIRYVTEASFDAYIWQTLETKARFIAQVMRGDTGMRSAEDVELAALSYAEVKALASGNPLVMEKAGIDAEVAKLSLLKSQWDNQRWSNQRESATLPGQNRENPATDRIDRSRYWRSSGCTR